MSVADELVKLFTEEPMTWESSWVQANKRPDPKDKFWKFRPASREDWKKDKFGAFRYTQKSVALLNSPLTIAEMSELYVDLSKRDVHESNHDAFEAERTLLAMDIMDVVASRVKHAKYPKIVASQLFSEGKNFLADGLKTGDRYREATLVYPSSDQKKAYVKGQMIVPSIGTEVDAWMGPYEIRWNEVDTSKNRSGILVDFEEGPVYYWWFDAFRDAVALAANKIHFFPSEQITKAQNLKIKYTHA
jgi:hypothetical protein